MVMGDSLILGNKINISHSENSKSFVYDELWRASNRKLMNARNSNEAVSQRAKEKPAEPLLA